MLNRVSAGTLPCDRTLFCFLHLLRWLFSSSVGQQVLDDSTKFAVLCSVRVSVSELYGSLCRTLQIGQQNRFL